jgi:hypothetical protein
MTEPLRPGKYRHFKGGEYEVIGVARHSETDESLVVYRPLHGDDTGLWVRPLTMFQERVTLGNRTVARFEFLGPKSAVIPTLPRNRDGSRE